MTAARLRPRAPSRWTLRTKLVASTVLLFTVVSVLTGAATAYALGGSLMDQLDTQVGAALMRAAGPRVPRGDPPPDAPGDRGMPPGPGAGFLEVTVRDGEVVSSTVLGPSGNQLSLTSTQAGRLREAGLSDRPTSLDLGGRLGTYRLAAASTADGDTVIVGRSTRPVKDTVTRLVLIIVVVSAGGLAAVIAGGAWLARANLRPLRRVAATAGAVSRLPLDSGAVALAERVQPRDTDRRTEVGQVGAALNELLDHVGEALTARHDSETRVRQFVADASHELRSPLASIQGYAELSRHERDSLPPDVAHALNRVESEAHRMGSLVDDLLLLARLDAGRPLARDRVDLTQLVIEAVGDAHAAGPDHDWRIDVPDEPVEVTGDRHRLQQVVLNLLTNARTHTPAGTHVTVRVERLGGSARLTVADDGPGVPRELLDHVFARFARGDSSRSRVEGSTGLGLAIVEAVAQAHGGAVRVSSVPGRTEFEVTLAVHGQTLGQPQVHHRVEPQADPHGLPDLHQRTPSPGRP